MPYLGSFWLELKKGIIIFEIPLEVFERQNFVKK